LESLGFGLEFFGSIRPNRDFSNGYDDYKRKILSAADGADQKTVLVRATATTIAWNSDFSKQFLRIISFSRAPAIPSLAARPS
jgi:hypothetical protein